MSSNVDFFYNWVPPEEPQPESPVSPDEQTRASFGIQFSRQWITRHSSRNGGDEALQNQVRGSLAGLADWFVEHWVDLNWEIGTPFEKAPERDEPSESGDSIFPSSRQADQRWPRFTSSNDPESKRETIANWQHRHLVGHATADIALPSIAVVPEFEHVLVEVDELPASLDAPVEFVPPNGGEFPALFVFRKTTFFSEVADLIESVIERGEAAEATEEWARWLRKRWERVRKAEKQPNNRLRAMLEPAWADRVLNLQDEDEGLAANMQNLLVDCDLQSAPNGEFDSLTKIVEETIETPSRSDSWKSVDYSVSENLPLYVQGYHVANRLRETLDLGDAPIQFLKDVLDELDIDLEPPVETELFRTAFCADLEGRGKILRSSTAPRMRSIAGSRFAIAAALGRLLFAKLDPGSDRTTSFSGGHGEYARWRETRRANAFAIEFLMPKDGIEREVGDSATRGEISRLSDDYGVSLTAAKWHAYNRGFAPRPN